MMTKQVRDAIISMKEYNRYYKGLFAFVGFNKKWIEHENVKRAEGETKWSFWKLLLYSIEGIMAFSTVPLAISAIMGIKAKRFCFATLPIAEVRPTGPDTALIPYLPEIKSISERQITAQ